MSAVSTKITAIGVAGALVAFAGVGGLGWVGYQNFLDSKGVIIDPPDTQPVDELPDTPVMLVVQANPAGEMVGATLLVETPERNGVRSGGWVIDIPPDILATMPDTPELDRLAQAYARGGVEGALTSVESLLQITLDGVEAVGLSELADAIAPYAPFTVTLDEPVPDPIVDGQLLIDAGTFELSAQQVAQLLTVRVDNELPVVSAQRREALWGAVTDGFDAEAAATSTTAAPTSAAATVAGVTTTLALPVVSDPTVAEFLASIRTGEHVTTTVSTQFVCNEVGFLTMQLQNHTARLLMAKSMPARVSPGTAGARVRVVNPLDDQTLLVNAAQSIDFGGFNLIMAGAGSDDAPAQTLYQYSDERLLPAVNDLILFLGEGTPELVDTPIDGIDITVTLGTNFADRIEAERASPPLPQPPCEPQS